MCRLLMIINKTNKIITNYLWAGSMPPNYIESLLYQVLCSVFLSHLSFTTTHELRIVQIRGQQKV